MTGIPDNPILTEEQKGLLLRLRESPLRDRFHLTGGTALSAFYLHHRLSEDLDFFTDESFELEEVLAFVKSVPGVQEVQYERKYDRRIFLLRYPRAKLMKVEFTTYPFPRCEEGPVVDGIRIESLRDILANKLMALSDRRDPKDYVDLYFLFKRFPMLDFESAIRDSQAKFGIKGIPHILRGRFLEGPPPLGILMMRETFDPDALSEFFTTQARRWIARSTAEESSAPN